MRHNARVIVIRDVLRIPMPTPKQSYLNMKECRHVYVMYVHMHVCTYISLSLSIHIYIYNVYNMYVYIYIYIHTYMHTYHLTCSHARRCPAASRGRPPTGRDPSMI